MTILSRITPSGLLTRLTARMTSVRHTSARSESVRTVMFSPSGPSAPARVSSAAQYAADQVASVRFKSQLDLE